MTDAGLGNGEPVFILSNGYCARDCCKVALGFCFQQKVVSHPDALVQNSPDAVVEVRAVANGRGVMAIDRVTGSMRGMSSDADSVWFMPS